MNNGDRPPTATLLKGTVKEKAATPSSPHNRPAAVGENIARDHVPAGGLNLWARLPDGTDLDQLTQACERAGVLIAPGTEWFPAEPTGPFLRLNFSGSNPAAFPEAARILGVALDHQRR